MYDTYRVLYAVSVILILQCTIVPTQVDGGAA